MELNQKQHQEKNSRIETQQENYVCNIYDRFSQIFANINNASNGILDFEMQGVGKRKVYIRNIKTMMCNDIAWIR